MHLPLFTRAGTAGGSLPSLGFTNQPGVSLLPLHACMSLRCMAPALAWSGAHGGHSSCSGLLFLSARGVVVVMVVVYHCVAGHAEY